MCEIAAVLRFHVELHYHVLAHLDLGRDAANLYDASLPARPWVDALLDAYREAPGRLRVHALPLRTETLPALLQDLREAHPRPLRDAAGRTLMHLLERALLEERADAEARWHTHAAALGDRAAQVQAFLQQELTPLRADLWPTPPALVVHHAAALARIDARPSARAHGGAAPVLATGGRGTRHAGRSVVAVSFDAPLQQVLLQVLHEETHLVSDAAVRERFVGIEQETAAGSPGALLHAALERAAIARAGEAIARAAPHLSLLYLQWCRERGWALNPPV